jgi:hypothetical protein
MYIYNIIITIIIDYGNNDKSEIKYNHLWYNIIIIPFPLVRLVPTTPLVFFLAKFYGHDNTYTFLTRFVLFDCYLYDIY